MQKQTSQFFFFLSAMQECMWSKITPSVPVFYDTLSRIHPLPLLFFLTLGVLFHIYFKITIDFTWKSYLHVFPGLELCVKGTAMGEFDGFHGNIGGGTTGFFLLSALPFHTINHYSSYTFSLFHIRTCKRSILACGRSRRAKCMMPCSSYCILGHRWLRLRPKCLSEPLPPKLKWWK